MVRARRWLGRLLAATALGLGGCASEHYFINQPLATTPTHPRYAIGNLQTGDNSDSLLVLLSFSGGGYRAAALSYGVLEALAETNIHWEGKDKRLLDEVDFIAGVSGGSLTAAYYALYREQIFSHFETEVLRHDLQGAVSGRMLSPRGLWRQTSSRLGRADFLQQVLDETVFHGKTYGDLPLTRPMLFLNATEMKYGERFEFSQDQFDLLCSDLGSFPIARAVAASMAVPIVFSPVTLWNHSPSCAQHELPLPLKSHVAERRYVHLLDGGLVDNTGVKTPLEIVEARGGIIGTAKAAKMHGIRKRVFIVVNAQTAPDLPEDDYADTPGWYRQLKALINIPIDQHSRVSIAQLHAAVRQWQRELREAPPELLAGTYVADAEFYVIEVNLSSMKKKSRLLELQDIETSLNLTPQQIVDLKAFAKAELTSSPEWQRLLQDLAR